MKLVNLYLSEYQCYLLRQVLGDYIIKSRERIGELKNNGDCFDTPEIKDLSHFNKVLHNVSSDMDKILHDYDYSKEHEVNATKVLSSLGLKENNGGN